MVLGFGASGVRTMGLAFNIEGIQILSLHHNSFETLPKCQNGIMNNIKIAAIAASKHFEKDPACRKETCRGKADVNATICRLGNVLVEHGLTPSAPRPVLKIPRIINPPEP